MSKLKNHTLINHAQQSLNNLVANALPEVKELHMDYRREVDRLLKLTCESFIHEATHNVVGGLVLPMELLKTTKAAALNQKITEAMKHMKKVVPLVQEKMSLYLANKETEFILYKPIRVSTEAIVTLILKISLKTSHFEIFAFSKYIFDRAMHWSMFFF